jgi:hypothetical protein
MFQASSWAVEAASNGGCLTVACEYRKLTGWMQFIRLGFAVSKHEITSKSSYSRGCIV